MTNTPTQNPQPCPTDLNLNARDIAHEAMCMATLLTRLDGVDGQNELNGLHHMAEGIASRLEKVVIALEAQAELMSGDPYMENPVYRASLPPMKKAA